MKIDFRASQYQLLTSHTILPDEIIVMFKLCRHRHQWCLLCNVRVCYHIHCIQGCVSVLIRMREYARKYMYTNNDYELLLFL